MKYIIKHFEQVEKNLTKEVNRIKAVIDDNPHGDLIQLHIDFQESMKDSTKTEKEKLGTMDLYVRKEKQIRKRLSAQKDIPGLIDKQIELEMELGEVRNQLFYMRKRQSERTKFGIEMEEL